MPNSGLFAYAKDLPLLAAFYESLLGFARIHAGDDLVVLEESQGLQFVLHAIPASIAEGIDIRTPPVPRDRAALKFFFTVPSLDAAASAAPALGGSVLRERWQGDGFVACNAVDPEGNIFQLRERSP
jgi:predicted enzyme related to lactoylglutathione lyase